MLFRSRVFRSLAALTLLVVSAFLAVNFASRFQYAHASDSSTTAATSVTTKEYAIPKGSDPWGTAIDKYGKVWVALPGCDPSPTCDPKTAPGRFAIFNPATSLWAGGHNLPAGYAQPLFLAFDKAGQVWFPMPMNNSIGMYSPSKHTFQKWAVPTSDAGPWDVAIDGNGMIWFTEHYSNKIGRFNPTTHTFMEISTPASNSQPYGITVDASNNVWFTENNSSVALIAEYTTLGQLEEYKIRNLLDSNLTPHLIAVDPNGNIWWTEGFEGMIGELRVAQALPGTNNGVSEYSYPQVCQNCGMHTSGISIDSNGGIWFDDSLQSIFGSYPDSGSGSFAIYSTPTSNSHPHDGLHVDKQNHIWFDEEFANNLAWAVPA